MFITLPNEANNTIRRNKTSWACKYLGIPPGPNMPLRFFRIGIFIYYKKICMKESTFVEYEGNPYKYYKILKKNSQFYEGYYNFKSKRKKTSKFNL